MDGFAGGLVSLELDGLPSGKRILASSYWIKQTERKEIKWERFGQTDASARGNLLLITHCLTPRIRPFCCFLFETTMAFINLRHM